MMGYYVFFWLLQDLLTVLTWNIIQVPEIFLLSLVYRILVDGKDAYLSAIWVSFFGGLLWDLRWVGVPGFFTLGYVCVVMMVIWIWNTLPSSGKTLSVVFFLFWSSQVIPPLLPTLLLFENSGSMLFLVQQLCALPLIFLCVLFFAKRMKAFNV